MSSPDNHSKAGEVAGEPETLSIKIKNVSAECGKLYQTLDTIASRIALPESSRHDLRLVIEEAFSNIVKYAFPEHDACDVQVKFSVLEHTVTVTFIDDGIEFNPLAARQKPMKDIDHSEGGMGIHIIRSLTDVQEYKRIGNQNVFTLIKHYNPEN